jgi:hypothetical protein
VRGTRVITNTFDVARGQFSGGQVASTTRGGTNNLYVGGTYNLRARSSSGAPTTPAPSARASRRTSSRPASAARSGATACSTS